MDRTMDDQKQAHHYVNSVLKALQMFIQSGAKSISGITGAIYLVLTPLSSAPQRFWK